MRATLTILLISLAGAAHADSKVAIPAGSGNTSVTQTRTLRNGVIVKRSVLRGPDGAMKFETTKATVGGRYYTNVHSNVPGLVAMSRHSVDSATGRELTQTTMPNAVVGTVEINHATSTYTRLPGPDVSRLGRSLKIEPAK